MKNYLLLLLLCLPCIFLHAQTPYVFSLIDSNHGLSENRVRSISQLPDGRMLIATEGLINIYNGTSFNYIHANEKKMYPLINYDGFQHLYSESNGNTWIKNHKKLQYLDVEKETFVCNIDSILFAKGMTKQVTDFFMDAQHNLWCPNVDGELCYYNSSQKRASVFLPRIASLAPKDDRIYDVVGDEKQLFLFFQSGLMICFDINTRKERYRDTFITNQYGDACARTLLVVRDKQYLYQVRNGINNVVHRYNIACRKWEEVMQTSSWLNMLSVDSKGDVWLCGLNGLWIVSQDLQHKQFIPKMQLVNGEYIDTEISTIFHDRNNGLWVGSLNRGLLYYHPHRFKFKNMGHTLFEEAHHKDLRIQCFVEDENRILVGSQQGVYVYTKEAIKLKRWNKIPIDAICLCLYKDSHNQLWVSTLNKGLYCITATDVKQYPVSQGAIYNVYENSDGTIYLSTSQGLCVIHKQGDNVSIKTLLHFNESVRQVIAISPHVLLGISASQLFLYNDKTGIKSIPQTTINGVEQRLTHANRQYSCIYKDSRGLIWIGTQDGLNIWNPQNGYTQCFYLEDGLVNSSIKSIIEDQLGHIWVSTSNGISCITVATQEGSSSYTFDNFNQYDGVVNYEFLEHSVYNSSQGTLYWGGINGFNQTDAVETIKNVEQQLSPCLFIKMELFGAEVGIGKTYGARVILDKAMAATPKVELDYDQNYISFDFSAMNYVNPTQTYYRYQLKGVDEGWREVVSPDGIGKAHYTQLQPGQYTLIVEASTSNKLWNNKGAHLIIIVHPPMWQTTPAYIVYTVLALLLLFYSASWYSRWSKNRLIKQQSEDLEKMKLEFFTNISHELRTPLTLIITPLYALLKKIEEGPLKAELNHILRHSYDLLDLVNQLLDFRRLAVVGDTLHLSYFDIHEFVKLSCSSFQTWGASKRIELELVCSQDVLYLYADKDKLKRILNNLLSNAYKFTPCDGQISLKCCKGEMPQQNQEALTITVKDTGCGMAEKEKNKIFSLFYQSKDNEQQNTGSGIGLHLAQQYASLHGGTITVESQLNVGSSFTLYIPLNLLPDKLERSQKMVTNKTIDPSLTILVIEDNDDFRSFLINQLTECYNVIGAINGTDGWMKISQHLPDLIISDVMMPGTTGVELCSRLKSDVATSHIPIILLTAKSSDDAQIEGYTAGADAYITKPFNIDILWLRINRLLEQQVERKRVFKQAIVIQPEAITTTSLDEQLIRKALEHIEKNVDNTAYSVDQLSKDMNMDRTGLYRKLTAIIGQTPSAFIRSVRLKKAAQLLKQHHPVSEVSDLVGFGTVSYFSKCFQEEFGVKPSHYIKTK